MEAKKYLEIEMEYNNPICKDDYYFEELVNSYFKNGQVKGGEIQNEI